MKEIFAYVLELMSTLANMQKISRFMWKKSLKSEAVAFWKIFILFILHA